MAINPLTGAAEFDNLVSLEDLQTKERMQDLLRVLINYFEEEIVRSMPVY
jgi:hypothetical protein